MVDADVREFFHFAIEGRHVSGKRVVVGVVLMTFVAVGGTLLPRRESRREGEMREGRWSLTHHVAYDFTSLLAWGSAWCPLDHAFADC